MPDIKRVAVIGAGTMGAGIAHVCAVAGYETVIADVNPEAGQRAKGKVATNLDGGVQRGKISREDADAALARIRVAEGVAAAVDGADVVIEAVLEDMMLKQDLFSQISALVPTHTILATNTSALSVSQISAVVDDQSRFVGMHFFNPVHIMKLVEIVTHDAISEDTVAVARAFADSLGKEPITVKDAPGFASSRLGVILGLEAMRMVEQGVASPEDIDRAMELGYGHPMGPLRVTDLVGLDVRLAIADHLHREFGEDQYRAPQILRDKVAAGELGKKAGRGFYDWTATG